MGTFGEIVEPITRSTWEDWDDEITDNTALQWQWPLDSADKIDTLFILEGRYMSECVKMHPKFHLQLKNSILDANLHLFELPSNKYVCTIKDYNLLQSSEIVELLKPLLTKSKDVITIQTKPLLEYQTASQLYSPLVIREVTTSTKTQKLCEFKFEKLEQPNIVSGVAAGVTCLREHLELPATTLVYYIEHTEEYQTDEIQQILEKLKIIDSICKTKVNGLLNSNLYI
uniref:Proteasome assembly chaperone 1 n=1 Tax=Pararge aegeria TaxID=116150 RepID=S4P867_9NEOP